MPYANILKKTFRMFIALYFLVLSDVVVARDDARLLVINSGSSAPMVIDNDQGFYPQLIHTLFSRLHRDVKTIHLPSSASIRNVSEGIDDGLIARIGGLEKKNKELLLVNEKVIDLEFVAYSSNKNIEIRNWDDLQNYNIAYIRGWKIYDKNVTKYKSLQQVKKPAQMYSMLEKDRVDVILYQDIPGNYLMKQLGYYPHKSKQHLARHEMFIYMNKKHAELVPLMEAELRKMKQDGSYAELYKKNITDMISVNR